jgi:hypothetical protein
MRPLGQELQLLAFWGTKLESAHNAPPWRGAAANNVPMSKDFCPPT